MIVKQKLSFLLSMVIGMAPTLNAVESSSTNNNSPHAILAIDSSSKPASVKQAWWCRLKDSIINNRNKLACLGLCLGIVYYWPRNPRRPTAPQALVLTTERTPYTADFQASDDTGNNPYCSICLNTETSAWQTLTCEHVFHRTCLHAWTSSKGYFSVPTCPVCRRVINDNQPRFHRDFSSVFDFGLQSSMAVA